MLRPWLLLVFGAGAVGANPRPLISVERSSSSVFVEENQAKSFLQRKLLYNNWDFELFIPCNLERECQEEVCNFEEANECFENVELTNEYVKANNHESESPAFDVAGLVAGLIGAFVLLILMTLVVIYFCKQRGKRSVRPPVYMEHSPPPVTQPVATRPEEVPLTTLESVAPGLPSYEEALERSGQHDAMPPPYRGGSQRV
uniref:Transmembrane gamma-carboxyglutamic acid protein 2-like protein n=1 Tax=Callorhinchus milii TaxID=7868 RepID=V9LB61_CALMI